MNEYQPKLFYEKINYEGQIRNFYFHGIQPCYEIMPDLLLYNPDTELGSTLSNITLDKLIGEGCFL